MATLITFTKSTKCKVKRYFAIWLSIQTPSWGGSDQGIKAFQRKLNTLSTIQKRQRTLLRHSLTLVNLFKVGVYENRYEINKWVSTAKHIVNSLKEPNHAVLL